MLISILSLEYSSEKNAALDNPQDTEVGVIKTTTAIKVGEQADGKEKICL